MYLVIGFFLLPKCVSFIKRERIETGAWGRWTGVGRVGKRPKELFA